jgi:ribonuclease G
MSEEILVNVTPQETRVAVMHLGAVQELHIERAQCRGLVSNIYLGRVVRVLPGMQSAFIDIGLERAAFLHVADIWAERHGPEPERAIEHILHEGQTIMVQVVKDPIGTKGARLSTQISFAGRYLVYLPQETHIGISQKIEGEEERESLRQKLHRLMPADSSGGFIVRTMAESAEDSELQADIEYLRRLWHNIQSRENCPNAPCLLYQDLDLALRVLRDFINPDTSRIQIDSRETWQRMVEFARNYTSEVVGKLQHYTAERPLFDLYMIEEEVAKALGRRVDLKSGGYLVIDQTEALTTVDVNTGGFVGARNFDDTIFKTNLEAAQAIARQLRLRNLGGIIILDLIDMDNHEHQEAVLTELRKAMARDPARTTISGFSHLGLVEMTRKRTRESLAHILCEPCPTCQGRGQIKTAQTVCYDALREILREARQFVAREYRIIAAQSVIDLFLDEESASLAQLGDFIGKPISLQVESSYSQEQYDIILL